MNATTQNTGTQNAGTQPTAHPSSWWDRTRRGGLRSSVALAVAVVCAVTVGSPTATAAPPPTTFGDWDGDGWSDVIVRNTENPGLRIYRGSADGLLPPVQISSNWNGMNAIERHGDMGGDSHEDLVARQGSTGELFVYLGTGQPNPAALSGKVRVGASGWNAMTQITLVGDLDGDTKGDLVAVQKSTGQLFLYPGRGAAPFGARRLLGSSGWNGMDELTGVGDLDADGDVDLIAKKKATGDVYLYPGTGTGGAARFGPAAKVGSASAGWRPMERFVGVGDFDRDGKLNLLAVASTSAWTLLGYSLTNGHLVSAPTDGGPGWRPVYNHLF